MKNGGGRGKEGLQPSGKNNEFSWEKLKPVKEYKKIIDIHPERKGGSATREGSDRILPKRGRNEAERFACRRKYKFCFLSHQGRTFLQNAQVITEGKGGKTRSLYQT